MNILTNFFPQKLSPILFKLKTNLPISIIMMLITYSITSICNHPHINLNIIYTGLVILFICLHINLIKFTGKNFHQTKDCNSSLKSIITVAFKIFLFQLQIFLITNWLLQNLLAQGRLHKTLGDITQGLSINPKFTLILNSIGFWLIFISIIMYLGIYKHILGSYNRVIAKLLFPNPNNKFKIFLHNVILGIEFYIKITSIFLIYTTATVNVFEYCSHKYNLISFFNYPLIVSFLICIIFIHGSGQMKQFSNYLCKRTNLSLVNIINLIMVVTGVAIYTFVQLFLYHLNNVNILNQFNSSTTNIITRLFEYSLNQERIKILFIGLYFIISLGLITEKLVLSIKNYKIKTIYYVSLIFPIFYVVLASKFNLHSTLIKIFATKYSTLFFLSSIPIILNYHYDKIHHLLCYFNLEIVKNNLIKKNRINFHVIIYKLIIFCFLFFNFYYILSWFFIQYYSNILLLLGLPVIIMLFIKTLEFNSGYNPNV